jgi:hypothetical protein
VRASRHRGSAITIAKPLEKCPTGAYRPTDVELIGLSRGVETVRIQMVTQRRAFDLKFRCAEWTNRVPRV